MYISELQNLRSEGTKAKLTGKVPSRDWLQEAKQNWKRDSTPENLRRLNDALEEHEDQIVLHEKMFLKHARFLSPTEDDADVSDLSRCSVILTRHNTWRGTAHQLPEQFQGGERCSICMDMIGPSGAYLIATCPHIFHIECLVMTFREGEDKCPNCRNPFHRDMIRKFYMERVRKFVHPTSCFEDPTAQRRTNLILPFLYMCFERYLIAFETGVPLEQRREMFPSFIAEVIVEFPDSVLHEEDRFPSPYDLRTEVKHLLKFYLVREIAEREGLAEYMGQVGADFSTKTWPPECWNSRVIERNLAVVYGGRGTTVPPNARFQILG
ncbi:hypothetical protein R1sor_016959 [Riccia sorocarpa]|uniref:RING-type domain-containing protein n=1 Tax=Riccia sorocarpa TaxID=122646 RepID=A0ABD3I9F1_9MARC